MNSYFVPDGQLHPCSLSPGLHTALLPSGLKVLIKEDRRTPVAVCNVWVRVGSNREPEKLQGWSHGIEHMLFKGTPHRDEGDFAREVAAAGGSTNAGTGYETTNYHITLPAENLPVAVDILGDALLASVFAPDSLDAERKVLVHENHMYDDIPFGFGVTWRWGLELAFDRSPYRNPIGGQDANLLERDREDILAFYRSAYRLDNMTLVVVGDVDPAATLELVAAKFKPPTPAPAAPSNPEIIIVADPPQEEPHNGCRLRVEEGDIKRAYAKLIFPGPGEKDDLRPVLSVVRRVLSDGRSCRLYRRIQEELKLVDDFLVMTETGPREGVVIIDLETHPERLAQAIRATMGILAEMGRHGCTRQELDRARIRATRSFIFGEETVQGQASTLGYHEAIDDLEGAFNFPDRVAGVTSEAVARFCGTVFVPDNLSCMIYLPEGTRAGDHGIPVNETELAELVRMESTDEPQEEAPVGVATGGPAIVRSRTIKSATDAPFQQALLDNGAAFCFRQDRSLPILAMTLTVKGGATGETATNAGLSTLTQVVQVKGTGDLSSEAIHEALEGEGASLAPRTERDFTGMAFSALSQRLDQALDLAGRLVVAPSFPQAEIEQERRLALEQLAALQDSPFQAAAVEFRKLLYGDHPYGRPLAGTEDSLPNLRREHLLEAHHQAWTAANLQIVVSGDFVPQHMQERLSEVLADLPAGVPLADPDPGEAQQPEGVISRRLERDQNQSVVLVGWPGVKSPDEDRAPLLLLKEVLNGQAGRLFEALRNRRSLCYNTGTLSTAGFGQGLFLGYVLTAPDTENDAREALIEELAGMGQQLVEGAEFERARAKLLGNLLLSAQSNSSRVMRAGQDLMFGRDPNDLPRLVNAIRATTPEEVRAVAARIITPDHRFQVSMGPAL